MLPIEILSVTIYNSVSLTKKETDRSIKILQKVVFMATYILVGLIILVAISGFLKNRFIKADLACDTHHTIEVTTYSGEKIEIHEKTTYINEAGNEVTVTPPPPDPECQRK